MWSLGCTLYLLLSGQIPFRDLNSRLADGRVVRGEWNMDAPVSSPFLQLCGSCRMYGCHHLRISVSSQLVQGRSAVMHLGIIMAALVLCISMCICMPPRLAPFLGFQRDIHAPEA